MSRAPSSLCLVAETPASPGSPPASGRFPRRAGVASAVCGAAALVVVVALHAGAEERALQRLSVRERAALYRRTIDNLTSVCAGEGRQGLREFCRDQARLALMFEECDQACESAAREQLRMPTR